MQRSWEANKLGRVIVENLENPNNQTESEVNIFRLRGTLRQHVENQRVVVFERLNEYFQNVGTEDEIGYRYTQVIDEDSEDEDYQESEFVNGYKYDLILYYFDSSTFLLSVTENELAGIQEIPGWYQTQGSVHMFYTSNRWIPAAYTDMFRIERVQQYDPKYVARHLINPHYLLFEKFNNFSDTERVGVASVSSLFFVNSEGKIARRVRNAGALSVVMLDESGIQIDPQTETSPFLMRFGTVVLPFYLKDVQNARRPPILIPRKDGSIFIYMPGQMVRVEWRTITVKRTFSVSNALQDRLPVNPTPTDVPLAVEQPLIPLTTNEQFSSGVSVAIRIPDSISNGMEYMYAGTDGRFYIRLQEMPERTITEEEFAVLQLAIELMNADNSESPPFVKKQGVWIRSWLSQRVVFDDSRRVLIDGVLAYVKF